MLTGWFHALWLFDVAEAIDVHRVRAEAGAGPGKSPPFRLPAPEYVRFAKPPVVVGGGLGRTLAGVEFNGSVKFFDYGVLSVELVAGFRTDWAGLTQAAQDWMGSAELEGMARGMAERLVKEHAAALTKPGAEWMSEDYYVVHLLADEGTAATEVLGEHGGELAQIVRGEARVLSAGEQQEVLRGSMSYYPNDLLVAGWTAAVVCDTAEGAADTIQILEYANSQLLEFRYYDEVLTRELAQGYRTLETRRGMLKRWHMARDAERLNALRLDVVELAERSDNALKFLGDMYYARVHRLASERVGVNDYRKLVDAKLATTHDLYDSMVTEFHHWRAYVLELAVVIILIIDLYFILREAKLL